jgi:hypothetical protein
MHKWRDAMFVSSFGLLATHELDAVRCFEWRVLPITRFLPEELGMILFILVHIPLFGWLANICWHADGATQLKARRIFAGFCVVHVGLHWLFRNDPNYLFSGWLSNGLIGGAGIFAVLFIWLTWQETKSA